MDYETLTRAERRTYQEAVSQTHHRRVELHIQRLDGDTVHLFTNRIMDAQWDYDDDSTPESTLSGVELYDPDRVLDWKNGAHRKFRARVVDSRFIPAFDDWVDVVVFTGPLWDFTRQGAVATLNGQGSERLAMGSVRGAYSKPRKARATDVIDGLLAAAGVPKRLRRIPNLKVRLPESVTVRVRRKGKGRKGDKKDVKVSHRRRLKLDHEDTYLDAAKEVAEAIGRTLRTDGKGRFVVRRDPTQPALTIGARHLVEPVRVQRVGNEDLRNVFIVYGKKPKGRKKRIRAEARFPERHVLSAESLSPWETGKPYELIRETHNDKIGTHKRAKEIVRKQRDRAARETVEYSVAMLPVAPWLRPGQLVRVRSDDGVVVVRAARGSLPLGTGADPQVIGQLRRMGGIKDRRPKGRGGRGNG